MEYKSYFRAIPLLCISYQILDITQKEPPLITSRTQPITSLRSSAPRYWAAIHHMVLGMGKIARESVPIHSDHRVSEYPLMLETAYDKQLPLSVYQQFA